MKIQYYKTNCGIFFKPEGMNSPIRCYIINGIEGELLPKYNSFYLVKGNELDVKVKKPGAKKLDGWKLKNPALESYILPLVLEQGKIVEDWDEDNEKSYVGDFGDYHSLYEQAYKDHPATIEPVELTLICLGELHIDNLNKPEKTSITLTEGNFGGEVRTVDLADIVNYDDLLRIVVPDFMLHNHACSLTSKQVYQIVRCHVKEFIDRKQAEISSDYDFSFAVNKLYASANPVKVSKEVLKPNGRSYATPRFTTMMATGKKKQIFNMVWKDAYGKKSHDNDYTVMEPWKADNLLDMQNQVKVYLNNLMEVLNKELKECSCCEGTGFVQS